MIDRLKSVFRDEFIRNNFIFFCGSSIVAVFNYLYHPILGRIMSVEEFGEVQTLISLFVQLAIISSVFRIIVVNIVSNHISENKGREIILALYKIALYFILILSVLIIVLSSYLKTFFRFSSFYPFISLALISAVSLKIAFREAILQGNRNFKALSVSQAIGASGRLVFAMFLVYAGWSTLGAISGIIIAQIIALKYISPKTDYLFNSNGNGLRIAANGRIRAELKYGFLVLVVTLCTTFLYTSDIIIVKHYFPTDIAGFYSGISIIARIIFFVTASTAGVLLASVKMSGSFDQNRKVLTKSFFLVSVMGGLSLVIFSLFPGFIINTFIGSRYLDYSYLLPRLSLVLFLVSLINLFSYYMLALRNYAIAAVSISGLLAVSIASFLRHDTLIHIVDNFLLGASIVLALLFFLYKEKFVSPTPRT